MGAIGPLAPSAPGERALAVAEEAERHAEVAGGAAGGLDPAIRATRWPNGTFAEALFAVPPFGAVPPAAALGRIEKVVLRSTQVEDGPDRNHLRVIFPGAA